MAVFSIHDAKVQYQAKDEHEDFTTTNVTKVGIKSEHERFYNEFKFGQIGGIKTWLYT
jgi:hypothetical protein